MKKSKKENKISKIMKQYKGGAGRTSNLVKNLAQAKCRIKE